MPDIEKYEKREAIFDLLDEYDMLAAGIDAENSLMNKHYRFIVDRMKIRKPANIKMLGTLRLMNLKKNMHLNELKLLTIEHYKTGLYEKLKQLDT